MEDTNSPSSESRQYCLFLLGGSALSGVLRFIHSNSILLSMYYMLGPLIKPLHYFSFFFVGDKYWRINHSGHPSSLPPSSIPNPRTFHNSELCTSLPNSSTKGYQLQSLLLKRNSTGSAKSAQTAMSASCYLPHLLVMLTNAAASSWSTTCKSLGNDQETEVGLPLRGSRAGLAGVWVWDPSLRTICLKPSVMLLLRNLNHSLAGRHRVKNV